MPLDHRNDSFAFGVSLTHAMFGRSRNLWPPDLAPENPDDPDQWSAAVRATFSHNLAWRRHFLDSLDPAMSDLVSLLLCMNPKEQVPTKVNPSGPGFVRCSWQEYVHYKIEEYPDILEGKDLQHSIFARVSAALTYRKYSNISERWLVARGRVNHKWHSIRDEWSWIWLEVPLTDRQA
jgi:hypothetical protein